MQELARRFRRGAQERAGLRYSRQLRQVALDYAELARAQGQGQREIAEALELPEATLTRWQKARGDSVALHEVVVVDRPQVGQLVLVLPSGARVEGLSVPELVSVLEALG
jgi:hypothetical protein